MSTIQKTAGRQYRLYAEDGTVLGTFKKISDAKKRQLERETFLRAQKKKKKKS